MRVLRFLCLPPLFVLMTVVPVAACPYLRNAINRQQQERELQTGPGSGTGLGIGGGLNQQMWDNHMLMDRNTSTINNNGTISIIATTTSEDPAVATLLQIHVAMMNHRVHEGQVARRWDPFFVAWFERYQEFTVNVTNVTQGVEVVMTALTDCGQALLEGHTAVVTLFVETGLEEGSKAHDVPEVCLDDYDANSDNTTELLIDEDEEEVEDGPSD